MSYEKHTHCRVCDSQDMTSYLHLGWMPLSNNLCDTKDEDATRYPLNLLLCNKCGLSQLSIVVDPVLLFSNYVYRSSISAGYREHCKAMAADLKQRYNLTAESFHIDIAGNDGALIKEFGMKSLNVDPAENMGKINAAQGIRFFNTFWGIKAAQHLQSTCWPMADLITATNVFAHVDKVSEFLEAVRMVLKREGVLVLEFPYLIDFIEKGEFDTIYFEHLSYFSIKPLVQLCESVGLNVMRVEKQAIHGGSVRVHIGYGMSDETVREFIVQESEKVDYYEFSRRASECILRFRTGIQGLTKVAGFAASAKGNTILNCAGITATDMMYIVDETPEKIGKYSPGTHIPIVSMEAMTETPPDYLVILSWNFADEIKRKCREAGYTGKFIMPLEFEICD